jgi:hypothetical protein
MKTDWWQIPPGLLSGGAGIDELDFLELTRLSGDAAER